MWRRTWKVMQALGIKSLQDPALLHLKHNPYQMEWLYLNILKDEEEEFETQRKFTSYLAMFINPEGWKAVEEQIKAKESGVIERATVLAAQGPPRVDPKVSEYLKKMQADRLGISVEELDKRSEVDDSAFGDDTLTIGV